MAAPAPTWQPAQLSGLGWALALIILIVTIIMAFMHIVDVPIALLIAAICAVRL
jgi:hypothetical protein